MDRYGYKLANNPLLLIFYKKKTGTELNEDLMKILGRNKSVVNKLIKNKNTDKVLKELTDEELESIDISNFEEIVFNLFYACRCAYERKELDYYEIIAEELKIEDVMNPKFIEDLINFVYANLKKK